MLRNVLRLCAIAVMCTAMSACLPDGDLGDRTEKQEAVRQAQATGLARSLSVVGAQGFGQFVNNNASPFWQALNGGGGIAAVDTQVIDLQAMFGMNMGPASQMVSAGYCADGAADTNRSMVVWLNQRDENGRFTPLGLGTGGTGAVMAELMKMNNPASVGLANGNMITTNDGANLTLGNCANAFNIPVGAPVMVFANLQEAAGMQNVTRRTETRTVACAADKTGTITQRRTVTVQPGGAEDDPAWDNVSELCFDSAETIAARTIEDSTSNLLTNLTSNLQNAELQEALTSLNTQKCKSMIIQRKKVDPNTGKVVTENYDTCAGSTAPKPVSDLERFQNGDPTYETKNGACSVGNGSGFADNIRIAGIPVLLPAQITAGRWGPDNGASYRRKVTPYKVRQPDGSYSDVVLRDSWEGVSLSCNRGETAVMDIEDYAPNWADISVNTDNLVLISNGGISYQRTATVNGWADPRSLSPNPATYSPWQLVQMDAVWQEREVNEFECSDELRTMATQTRTRTHTLIAYKQVETSDWTTTDTCPDTPQCTQTTLNESRSCRQAGYSGSEEFTRTLYTGGDCSADTGWQFVSSNCAPPTGPCVQTTQSIRRTCPLGQAGEQIFTRISYSGSSCPATTETLTSDTCRVVACPEAVEDDYRACDAGFMGQKHFRRTINPGNSCTAEPTDWVEQGDSSCVPVCEPAAIDGVCGSANNVQSTTAPTSNLCQSGTPSWTGGDQTGTDGTFNWSCIGSTTPRGDDVTCSAPKPLACAPAYGDTCEGGTLIREAEYYYGCTGVWYQYCQYQTDNTFSQEACFAAGGNCYQYHELRHTEYGTNEYSRQEYKCFSGATSVTPQGTQDHFQNNDDFISSYDATLSTTCQPGEYVLLRTPVSGARAHLQYDQSDANRAIAECNAAGGTRHDIQEISSTCRNVYDNYIQETWCDFELTCYGR